MRAAVCAAALAVAALAAGEAFWRGRGVRPSVADSATLWAAARTDLPAGDRSAVAAIGASRMHAAFDSDLVRDRLPGRAVRNLAIEATAARDVLADFAADPTFRGVLLVGVTEDHLAAAPGGAAGYVGRAAAGVSAGARLGEAVRAAVQARCVTAGGQVGWGQVVGRLRAGRGLPAHSLTVMRPDRDLDCRFLSPDGTMRPGTAAARRARAAAIARRLTGPPPDPAAWLAAADGHVEAAAAIAARGGRVLFVRMPTSGAYRELADRHHPRGRFWDRFAAAADRVPGVAAVHFRDVPALADLRCPDGSHLDAADKPRFTAAILAESAARGFLEPPPRGRSERRAVSPGGRRRVH